MGLGTVPSPLIRSSVAVFVSSWRPQRAPSRVPALGLSTLVPENVSPAPGPLSTLSVTVRAAVGSSFPLHWWCISCCCHLHDFFRDGLVAFSVRMDRVLTPDLSFIDTCPLTELSQASSRVDSLGPHQPADPSRNSNFLPCITTVCSHLCAKIVVFQVGYVLLVPAARHVPKKQQVNRTLNKDKLKWHEKTK